LVLRASLVRSKQCTCSSTTKDDVRLRQGSGQHTQDRKVKKKEKKQTTVSRDRLTPHQLQHVK